MAASSLLSRVAPALVAALASTLLAAQSLPPLAPLLPTALAGARPHGLELRSEHHQPFLWTVSLAYGNAFSFADEVHRAHQALDPPDSPLSDTAWDNAAEVRGERSTWALDLEILRADLEASIALEPRWRLGVRLPVWSVRGTALDGWPSRWHSVIGVDDAGRELYPTGQSVYRLSDPGSELSLTREVTAELGDVTVWGGWVLPHAGRLAPRVWVSVTAPTGGDLGAAGWAGGLRGALSLEVGDLRLDGGIGLTYVAEIPGPWSAANPLWHAWVGGDLRLSDRWRLGILARSDASPYHEALSDRPASPSGELAVGPSLRIAEGLWLQIALGEDFPGMGLAPDFSIQTRLVVGSRFPRRAAASNTEVFR